MSRIVVKFCTRSNLFFFFNDTATTEIYTLSLHDALPIYEEPAVDVQHRAGDVGGVVRGQEQRRGGDVVGRPKSPERHADRKSTRLNSSHANISYAVFCLKKKKKTTPLTSLYQSATSASFT